MDEGDLASDPIREAFESWEKLNGSLKEAIDRQDWLEVDALQEQKFDCQSALESRLPPPETLSPGQRVCLQRLLNQEMAIGEQLQGVRAHLETERRRWETHRKQSQQLRNSYGSRPAGEVLWEHFT